MLALAIEGSTSRASIAIKKDSKILYEESSNNPKTHSEFLNAAVDRSLKETGLRLNDIDVFACSTGPGSFTGIRVASSIVKSFALLFKKKIYTTDSLTVMAAAAFAKRPQVKQVLCLLNAHKNMVYVALFEKDQIILAPASMKIEELIAIPGLDQTLGLGDGFTVYEANLNFPSKNSVLRDSQISDFPDASTLCDLAIKASKSGTTIEWNLYKPLYIRDSEAEEVLKLKTK